MANGDDSIRKNHKLTGVDTEKLDLTKNLFIHNKSGDSFFEGAPYNSYDPTNGEVYAGGLIKAAYAFTKETASHIAQSGNIFDGVGHGEFIPEHLSIYRIGAGEQVQEFTIDLLPVRSEDDGPLNVQRYNQRTGERELIQIAPRDEVLKYQFIGKPMSKIQKQKIEETADSEKYCIVDVEEGNDTYFLSSQLMQMSKQVLEQIYDTKYDGINENLPPLHIEARGKIIIGSNGLRKDQEVSTHIYGMPEDGSYNIKMVVPQLWFNC